MKTKLSIAVLALLGTADGIEHSKNLYRATTLSQTSSMNATTLVQKNNATSNATAPAAEIGNITKSADLEIATAPYNCTKPANGTAINKFDGLIHDEEGKRNFSDDGCVVGGVNDSYKYTGHPLNKTKDENFTQPSSVTKEIETKDKTSATFVQKDRKMFPDNDSKNPRIGNYTTEGEWVIPKSNATKFDEAAAKNTTNTTLAAKQSKATAVIVSQKKNDDDYNKCDNGGDGKCKPIEKKAEAKKLSDVKKGDEEKKDEKKDDEKKEEKKDEEKKEDAKEDKKEEKEEKKDEDKKEDAKDDKKVKYPIEGIGKKVQTEEEKEAYAKIVKQYPASSGPNNQNYKPVDKTLIMLQNPYYDEKNSPWTGNVGSESKLINQTKSYDTSSMDDLNFNVDGPQRHLRAIQLDAPIDSSIEQAVTFVQTQEIPAEIGGAPAEIGVAPAAAATAPRNPAWNVTQDTLKPYRYRESYGTMNDNYDTWNTQVKYNKQHLMQKDVDVSSPASAYIPYDKVSQDKTAPYRFRETYGTMNDIYDTYDGQIKYSRQQPSSFIQGMIEDPSTHKNSARKFGTYGTQDAIYDHYQEIYPKDTNYNISAASLAQAEMQMEDPSTHKNAARKFGTYGTQDAIYDAHEAYVNSLQPSPVNKAALYQSLSQADPGAKALKTPVRELEWDGLFHDENGKRYFPNGDPVDGANNYFQAHNQDEIIANSDYFKSHNLHQIES